MNPSDRRAYYDKYINEHLIIDLKGKTMHYTSLNGHMFSFVSKDGEVGIRLSKEDQKAYDEEHGTGPMIQYNSVMRGYVVITDEVLTNEQLFNSLLDKSLAFIKTLKPKPTKKKT